MRLNGTGDRIENQSFPMTSDELVETLGDEEIQMQNGSESLRDVLTRSGEETFETAEDARFAIFNGVSDRAIGRKGYSDRDPSPPGSPYTPETVSF